MFFFCFFFSNLIGVTCCAVFSVASFGLKPIFLLIVLWCLNVFSQAGFFDT